jgi:hypothetical protein
MAKMVKKAQSGRGVMDTKLSDVPKKVMNRVKNATVGDAVDVAYPGVRKVIGAAKNALSPRKSVKKSKNGSSFGMLSVKAGVDNNPNPTAADRIAGAKKKAKFGKKMQYGGEAASMVPMMKKGGMKKKYKHGGTVSMQLGSYDRQIGKNYTGKATKAVGLVKAMYGKSIMKKGGKCKNGC